jgi:PKD repeat protein
MVGSATCDPHSSITLYEWDFGDGQSATGKITYHSYLNPGTYTVTLTVRDHGGRSDTDTTTVTIIIPPIADVGGPYLGRANEIMTFDGGASYDFDGSIASYHWDFGDGSEGTGVTPSHIYSSPGTYTITLTVYDADGLSDEDSITTTIEEPFNTLEGDQVEVIDVVTSVSATFEQVIERGMTTVTVDTEGPNPPAGFEILRFFYNITTTAIYSGTISIEIHYDDTNLTPQRENRLKLQHWDSIHHGWKDVTTWIDTENNIIYGEVTSLSVFAVIELIDVTPPSTTLTLEGTEGLNAWWISPVTITLSANDPEPGSGVTEIYYRLDDESWISYTTDFVISADGVYNFEYYSVDYFGNEESIQYTSLKIDLTAPIVESQITGIPGLSNWYLSSVTLTLLSSDATPGSTIKSTYYQVDEGDWNSYEAALTFTNDGTYLIRYYCEDYAGNLSPLNWITINIDTTPPQTSETESGTPGLNNWWLSEVSVELSASDPIPGSGLAHLYYRIGAEVFNAYEEPLILTEDGTYNIEYYAVDTAGNIEQKQSLTIKIDKIPPQTTFALTGTMGFENWYLSSVTIVLSAFDSDLGSGVANIYYRINYPSDDWHEYTTPIELLNDGIYTIDFYSTDLAGNTETFQLETVQIDQHPPTTTHTLDNYYLDEAGLILVTSTSRFTLLPEDPHSGILTTYYKIDDGPWSVYTTPFTIDGVDGSYQISYYSVDAAGNTETPQISWVELVSFSVTSYVTDSDFNPIAYFDVVLTKSQKEEGYKLVATNPGQFYYHIEIVNNWPLTVDDLTLQPHLPTDFIMKGAMPIHVYLDGVDITTLCIIEGKTVKVQNIPLGSRIYVTVHLEYNLKGTFYNTLEDFDKTSYQFATTITGLHGNQEITGKSLTGTYQTSDPLIVHQKKTTAIAGFVLDDKGSPIVGITVTLVDSNGQSQTATTDENGFYYFVDIDVCTYTLIITYNSTNYTQTVTTEKGQLTEVNFTLI